jgi:hypothetical protein
LGQRLKKVWCATAALAQFAAKAFSSAEKSLASQLSKCHPWAIELLPNIGKSIASLFSASQRKTISSCRRSRAPKLRPASREQKQ